MQGGFSFCGVDIDTLGIEYAPDNANTYVYGGGSFSVSDESFEAHDGGYFYGTTVNPKVFTLRCFYQNEHVKDGVMTNLNRFFRRGRTGKLIFKERPWIWYVATVTSTDFSNMLNYRNGIVTIGMKAYYPYGRCDSLSSETTDVNATDIENNSALLPAARTPSCEVISDTPLTAQSSILLYNGGTERAQVAIEIAGSVGDGVTIANSTTNQLCKFVALSAAASTDVDKYVISDGLNGKTVLTNGTTTELAFLYHDSGFIELEPAYPIYRDVEVQYTANESTITGDDVFTADMAKQHIYVDGAWRKIVTVTDSDTVTITPSPTNSGSSTTEIVRMNEITITPLSSMSLTRLNFIYKPTFA